MTPTDDDSPARHEAQDDAGPRPPGVACPDPPDDADPDMTAREARGRAARTPWGVPLTGWRDIVLRMAARVVRDNLSLMAAGVAFFGLLALFPAIATLLSLAGLIFDTDLVLRQFDGLQGIAPMEPLAVVRDQAQALAEQAGGQAGATASVSLAVSLFWASRGVDNLVDGINLAHAELEKRNLIHRNLVSLGLTALLTILALFAGAMSVAIPRLAAWLGDETLGEPIVTWGRWPLLAALSMIALAVLYRYAPARRSPRWRWVSPGAVLATLIWLGGSWLFGFFVQNFGRYNPTYGALAGVVILLLWIWLTSFIVLLGAQFNAEIEHQTRKDSTVGPDRRMGRRGAHMADTLGQRP